MKKDRTEEKPSKLKKWSNNPKNCVRSMTLVHPFWTTFGVSMVLLFAVFIFRGVLVALDKGLIAIRSVMGEEFLSSVRADQGIETWFSFFGSYFGVIATVVLGIITLRLSFRLGQREQIAKVVGIRIKKMRLYDMFSDFAPSQWKHNDVGEYRFLLKIVLTEQESVYKFDINKVQWGNCDKDYGYCEREEFDYKVYVDNVNNTVIYIYFNEFKSESDSEKEESRDAFSYFYHIQEYEPLLLERHERYRWLRLDMKLTETTWIEDQEPDTFWVNFSVLFENNGKCKKCVKLHEIIHEMEIRNTPKKKYS